MNEAVPPRTESANPVALPGRAGGVPLRAEGLQKIYRMGRVSLPVLADCSIVVGAGEFVAIMGKSGSGKSTLLHILGTLDVPQGGQVYIADQPVFAAVERRRTDTSLTDVFSAEERRRIHLRRTQIGFVFQLYHLLPGLSILGNVLLTRMIDTPPWRWLSERAAARQDAREWLERVGLGQRLAHLPSELSGGERQRVAIARALVHRPRVLLADEPTGNLDSESGAGIMQVLRELHRSGQTIVMVTHDPGIARYADRVLRLESGVLCAATTPL